MKVQILLIFVLTIFYITIPTSQAADQQGLNYISSKDLYIKNNPGQAIIPYPWGPITSTKVLPFDYEIPAPPGNYFSIVACRNQFESASLIITARKNISGIEIHLADLYSAQGTIIPADAINVRTVKVWYQAAEGDIGVETPGLFLTPELLLKDDTLVNVDYETKTNYLKVTINGSEQYIDISNPSIMFPSNAQIYDTPSLQPFSLRVNENKQIWFTVHIPNNTPAGDYKGNITITTPSETSVIIDFTIEVLPFELEPSPIEYALYYYGVLPALATEEQRVGINSEWKTPDQYAKELQNMKDHGVLYPTIGQWYDDYPPYIQKLNHALSLREQTGLPTNHIYVLGLLTGNSTNTTILSKLEREIIQLKNITSYYGYRDIYIYGIDEARGDVLRSERPAWQTVHRADAKVFVAVSDNIDAVNIIGDILDVSVVAGPLNATQAAQWHDYGKRIFSYANPQVGVENPEIYRKNYGFALWNAGYDGAMNFAYQWGFGHIWNDYDSAATHYRDHVFAYPTSNGVIDTIQWEGWREGVDDTRYLASLMKKEGSDTSARAIVSDSLSKGEDMAAIRKKVIDQILITSLTSNEKDKIGVVNSIWKITRITFGLNTSIPVNGEESNNFSSSGFHNHPLFLIDRTFNTI